MMKQNKRKYSFLLGRRISSRGGYTMALALIALLVMVTLAAVLMTTAGNLRKRAASVAYQNTQCEILVEFLADELTYELQLKEGTLWNNIYTMIENQVWPRYDNTVSEVENRKTNAVQTYTMDLDFQQVSDAQVQSLLSEGEFAVTMDIYWEMSDQMYINTANKELVIRLICESKAGGYYAVILRYESYNENSGMGNEQYWFGKWLFLWQERA